jgi:hypothetical protein
MKVSVIICPKCKGTKFKSGEGTYICETCGYALNNDDRDNILNSLFEQHIADEKKKLFALNEGGVTEMFVAESKKQAYEFAKITWGDETMQEYLDEYIKDVEGSTLEDFIEDFCRECSKDEIIDLDGAKKAVSEWLEDVTEVPSWFAVED